MAETSAQFEIRKIDNAKQQVFGWAYVAVDKNGHQVVDHSGEFTTTDVLEDAAYEFVLKYRETDDMHEGEATGTLIESMVFTTEKAAALGIPAGTIPQGGWWVGFHVNDKSTFEKIRDGERPMLSIYGDADKVPVNV